MNRKIILSLFVPFLLMPWFGGSLAHSGTSGGSETRVRVGRGDKEKVKQSLDKLIRRFNYSPQDRCAVVVVSSQRLYLLEGRRVRKVYAVSTSKYGPGNRANSQQTPLGTHRIEEKYGADAPLGTIFRARISTGKRSKIHQSPAPVSEDLVTTRILHLRGLEEGVNQGKGIDSYRRMIYLHGTPQEWLIGTPASHGCIRLRNEDVIEVFRFLPKGSLVEICE